MTASNGAADLHRYGTTRSREKGAPVSAANTRFGRTAGAPSVVPSGTATVSSAYPCGLSVAALKVVDGFRGGDAFTDYGAVVGLTS
jgi:hypothetical protein